MSSHSSTDAGGKQSRPAFPLAALDADADGLHVPTSDPWWREGWYFEFYDPKSKLQFQAYQGSFPNQGTGDLTLAFFLDGQLIHRVMKMDYPLPAEPREGRLCFSELQLQMLEPFRRWDLRFARGEVNATIEFRAIHAPYSWGESNLFMEAASNAEQRSHHFDQVGRYQGTVSIGTHRISIDTLGFRDRMWGWGSRRDWKNYVVLWSAFGPDFVTNVSVQDFSTGHQHLCGYLYRDNQRALLTRAQVEIVWSEETPGVVARIDANLRDRLGREAVIQGHPQGIQDTSKRWPHRKDKMMFSVGEYRSEGRFGYGVMNWAYLDSAQKPAHLEASL